VFRHGRRARHATSDDGTTYYATKHNCCSKYIRSSDHKRCSKYIRSSDHKRCSKYIRSKNHTRSSHDKNSTHYAATTTSAATTSTTAATTSTTTNTGRRRRRRVLGTNELSDGDGCRFYFELFFALFMSFAHIFIVAVLDRLDMVCV
jgi:hypothetical protein